MAIRMNESTFYDNLFLIECSHCNLEFIVGEHSIAGVGITELRCPRCQDKHLKMIAKTDDESRAKMELGCCTLCYSDNSK